MIWTQDNIDRLQSLLATGMSCAEIGSEMGCTRNTVIGKKNRLGLSQPFRPSSHPKSIRRRALVAEKRETVVAARHIETAEMVDALESVQVEAPVAVVGAPVWCGRISGPKTIWNLSQGDCRWPMGKEDPVEFYCGAQVVHGQSYCEAHCRKAFNGFGRSPTSLAWRTV